MTKGWPGSVVFQALLIERAGSGVVCAGGRETETHKQRGEWERKCHGICD